MKIRKLNDELKQLGIEELKVKLEDYRRERFTLRLNAVTTHVKDYSQFNKAQRNIARVLTCLRQHEINEDKIK